MKKILIITYYWPPSGGGGVQRWLKFVKYLPDFGWQPIVVVPENPEYPVTDNSLGKDISEGTPIIRIPIWEPYAFFKKITGRKKEDKVNTGFLFDDKKKSWIENLSLWLRGNLLIPDPRIFWVRPVYRELKRKFAEINPDVVATTGPPHSVHLIGLKLHQKFGIKWIADFRDPWSTMDYLDIFKPTKYARNWQKKLEKKVLTNATLVLSVSENWKKELISQGAEKVAVITNGYDEDDFNNYRKVETEKFILTYTGLITSLRNPVSLWEILEQLLSEDEDFSNKFELRLVGNIDKQVLNFIKIKERLSLKTKFLGYLPHNEVLKVYSESSLLLLLLNNSINASGHIPGKLFEYLAAQTPILGIGDTSGDVNRILQETKAGDIFREGQYDQIKDFIISASKNKIRLDSNTYIKYSRKELTNKLINSI